MHRGKHGDQGSKVRSTAWFMLFVYLLPDKIPAPGARRFGGVSGIEAQTSLKLSIFFPELGILRLEPVYLRLHPLDEIEVILPLKWDHFLLWWLIGKHGQNELHTVDSKHQIHRGVKPLVKSKLLELTG